MTVADIVGYLKAFGDDAEVKVFDRESNEYKELFTYNLLVERKQDKEGE